MSKPTYDAVYELDDNGSWFVRVPGVQGAHSHGRTLARARENIREALALVLEVDENSFRLHDDVKLAADIRRMVDSARELRVEADELQEFAAWATEDVVKLLSFGRHPLSLRDTAELLGVSFQRVQQLRKKALDPAVEPKAVDTSSPAFLDLMEALADSVRHTREASGWKASEESA